MTEDKEAKRRYWSAILAAERKQLAALLASHMSLVDDNGHDMTPSAIATHERRIAEAERELAALDQIWTDRRA
jgi:uncharacterized protein YnzC (UPF0291/DUF896 family)